MLIEDVLTEFKRTHLEHIEDIVITDGYEGGKAVIEYFRGLLLTLKGSSSEAMSVSVKWDGAPAVVCGTNPDNGRFFVGTKSVFAKNAKINYTKKDIANNHGTDDLGQKLLKCLVHLKKLNIQGVVQGDLLFTDEDITRKNVDGKPNLTFTPNTITYAVPVASTSMYSRIKSAKIGIIFHTSYSGKTMKGLKASFGASISGLRKNSNVFFDNAKYQQSEDPGLTKGEEKQFNSAIAMAQGSVYKGGAFIDLIKKDKGPLSLGVQLKTFFNTYIRAGSKIGNAKALTNNFEVYFIEKIKKEIDSKKTDKAKQKYKEILEAGMKILRPNRQGLYFTIASYITLQTAKSMLLSKLNKIQSIGSFMRTKNGYKVTNPEGYVAINKGNAVKLVDRLVFSQANFNVAKDWVKG